MVYFNTKQTMAALTSGCYTKYSVKRSAVQVKSVNCVLTSDANFSLGPLLPKNNFGSLAQGLPKMAFSRLTRLMIQFKNISKTDPMVQRRTATTTPSGAILPEPEKIPFGLFSIVAAIVPGLLIGAAISKNIANFLEENELFVPSDDDDDDD